MYQLCQSLEGLAAIILIVRIELNILMQMFNEDSIIITVSFLKCNKPYGLQKFLINFSLKIPALDELLKSLLLYISACTISKSANSFIIIY